MNQEQKVDCRYYLNGRCRWSEKGLLESNCICIPNELGYKSEPENCSLKRILDNKLEMYLNMNHLDC